MKRYIGAETDTRKPVRQLPTPPPSRPSDELILLLSVELGSDRQEQLPVYAGDNITNLAKAFCHKHKLPPHLCEVLVDTIETNLKAKQGTLTERQNTERPFTDRSPGERTPGRLSKPGYVSRFEEKKMRPETAKPQTGLEPNKSVRALVHQALATKENQVPGLNSRGSSSRLQPSHKRSSSMIDQCIKAVRPPVKPTHTREHSEQVDKPKSPLPCSTPEPACESIVSQIKRNRYAEIYRAIKAPEDTLLRAGHVRTDLINSGLLKTLSPLLDELRDLGETLTLEEFQASMENLVAVLTRSERSMLFYPFELEGEPRPKSSVGLSDPVEVTECPFKPQRSSSHLRSSTLM